MHHARLFLLCALTLILTSCASLRKAEVVYLPPRIDCAAFEAPKVRPPSEPGMTERALPVWQLYAWAWQAYAEHVLTQRVETALCLQKLKQQEVIK